MLTRFNPIDVEIALRAATPRPPFPPASDRQAWEQVATELGSEEIGRMIQEAEEAASRPIPSLPATLFLEFKRTGRREGYQEPRQERRTMLKQLALAECLEYKGRFLDPILDVVWAICEESSWVLPAHQRELTDMDHSVIDLGVAMTALELAELDLLLGAELDPLVGKRIRYEVNRRCFTPYLTRHDHWWLHNSQLRSVNNWTAVCNGGVVGAAIYLEPDPARLAEMIARAARSLDDYLATFDPDGGSSEGPGYWSYGFGYYTILAHLVEHRTEGRVSFLDEEQIPKIARYPLRTVLSPGRYVNFSDCDLHVNLIAPHLAYLSRRLGIPELMQLAAEQPANRREQQLTWGLRSLFWAPDKQVTGRFVPARHDWFSGMMWMIARYDPQDPDALVLAAKGGHNGEMHNQNDVGNVIVHVKGESVIADIGRGRYTKAYFGPERYDHLVNSSFGHSVPIPNGQAQRAGREYAAVLLDHNADADQDRLQLELKGAYPPEADLASLRRTVALHRDPPAGWVELVDEVRFASGPGMLESVLTTFGQVDIGAEEATIRGERGALRVAFDPQAVHVRVETEKDVDLAEGPRDVQRIIFSFAEKRQEGTIRLRITPVD
ncbi:MAG: heparinase II/III family protein [Anaerolineae bacterium]